MPSTASLPRRDGQGRRRGGAVALVILWLLAAGCEATADQPPPEAVGTSPTADASAASSPSPPASDDAPPAVVGRFDLATLDEASGLALSLRNPGVVYVVDDGPGTAGVTAVDTASGARTTVTLDGMDGRDTEGLAVGSCDADGTRSCLFVGDIGNNLRAATPVRVWRVPEPAIDGEAALTLSPQVAVYEVPAPAADAEALLVDDGRPVVVTKERIDPATGVAPPPRLLVADAFADGVLRDVGRVPVPAPSIGLASAVVGVVVTGGERSADRVVLRTYDHVVVYEAPAPDAPIEALPSWPARQVDTPRLPQPEAVAIDGCGIWMTSEGVDSVWLVPHTGTPGDPDPQEQQCPSGTAHW